MAEKDVDLDIRIRIERMDTRSYYFSVSESPKDEIRASAPSFKQAKREIFKILNEMIKMEVNHE